MANVKILELQKEKLLTCLRAVQSEMSRWSGGLHGDLVVLLREQLEDCYCDNPKIGEDAYYYWHCDNCGGRIHKGEYELFEEFEQLKQRNLT